jgi:DNA polymerase-4
LNRAVIHLNVADFPVAVERMLDTRLKSRPVIVAADGAARATVFDMSEEAFQCGVKKGMRLQKALRRCREASVLAPHPDRYDRAMGGLLKQALAYSPLVEPGWGDGHLFVDVTGSSRLFGPPMDVAWRLRKQIRSDLGLDPIWSVAPSKLVAKVATRLVKPTGEYIVAAGEEEAFMAPLPIHLVPGIEAPDMVRLSEFNLFQAAQVAQLSLAQLKIPFASRARLIYEAVRGIDPSPVLPAGKTPPKLVEDHEFGNDTNTAETVEGALYRLVERAGKRLRRRRLTAKLVRVVLDYSDGVRSIRQMKARHATANDFTLFDLGRRVLYLAWFRRVRIRHIRLICDRLMFPPAQQLSLFAPEAELENRRIRLVGAIDAVRRRFGTDALRIGRTLAA